MSEPEEPSNHSITQSSSTQPEKVEINALGVPISKNAGKISSQIGKLVRIHVPISYENWVNVPNKYKMDVWKELLTFFDLDPDSKDLIFKKMSESFRKHKSDLRARYYDKYDNDEDRLKNCPPTIKQEDWEMFLKNEATPSAKERRDKGKKNRSLYSYGHHTGRTSHAVIEHEMAIENPTKEITRREVWERAHTKKDGTISDSASVYFEKIAKAKELVDDGDEEDLTLDEDIISQVFGKDKKGRTRSIGAKISRTQVKASNIARKQLKKSQGPDYLNSRMDNMEGKLNSILDLMTRREGSQQNHILDIAANEGGSGTPHDSIGRMPTNNLPNSLNSSSMSNHKCEIMSIDLEIIGTATVCRDSTASIIHGKTVPPGYEKLVVDSIRLPQERTSKPNHPLAFTFGEVGIGGYVCHPKNMIQYL